MLIKKACEVEDILKVEKLKSVVVVVQLQSLSTQDFKCNC